MSAEKQLWVLVGGNGAGKSTFYRLYLQPLGLPFVNADLLAQIAYPEAPEQSSLNQARISMRVTQGGHAVPSEKVQKRIPRLLEQVKKSLPLCDVLRAYDNSSADHPFIPVFTISNGSFVTHLASLPAWAVNMLAD